MKVISIVIALFFLSCNLVDRAEEDFIVSGLRPVYGDPSAIRLVAVDDTTAMVEPGRIVYLAPRLFVNEVDKGIHVINNTDPQNPYKEAFIRIPFNRDLAVKNNIIYADNDRDLISIRYHGPDSVQVLNRQEKVFDHIPVFPRGYRGYFECVDESKGVVIAWEEAELVNPGCRTF